MARIVCQVLHRADRVTFIWSDGAATFEPYHLEGSERATLLTTALQIQASFATAGSIEVTQLGQQLHRAIFPRDAAAVQTWLGKLIATSAVEKIEFLSDVPGLIPWNTLVDDSGAGPWGERFSIGAGRRVNALRQNPGQAAAHVCCVAHLDLYNQLSAAQQSLLAPLRQSGRLYQSAASLQDALAQVAPDVLMLLVRCERGQLRLGADTLSVHELQTWIDAAREGNPDPIIVLMGCGDSAAQTSWSSLVAAASAAFNGLIANEVLLTATQAFAVGHAFAQRYQEGKQNVGAILQALRKEHGAPALAFSAFCPPQVRVVVDGADDPGPELPVESVALPSMPYRPFAAFEAADRALLFGREDDVLHGALMLDRNDTLGMLLHGGPAVGKTSYLQAGLLPYLKQEAIGFRVLRDRAAQTTPTAEKDYPVLILRCTVDLAGQFADALSAFCAQPLTYTTPAGTQVTVDLPGILRNTLGTSTPTSTAIQAAAATSVTATPGADADDEDADAPAVRDLWIALRDNKGLLARLLDAITRPLPFELIITVDQGEDLILLSQSAQQQARRHKAIEMLAEVSRLAPRCKIVYTIRSQALGQFSSLFEGGRAPDNWRAFGLRPLTEAELADALLWPTNREELPYSGEVPHQKYGFVFEDGMAAQLAADAFSASFADSISPLAMLQAAGALLYDRQVVERKQDTLRSADMKDLGGVRYALGKYVERTIERLPFAKLSKQSLRALISKLYTSHADGTVSRDLLPAGELKSHWNQQAEPVETVVDRAAADIGLFEVQELVIGGRADTFISLPQDSLAQLGRKMTIEREQQAYGRAKMIDLLWIMIPLMFLAAAITFWATRQYSGGGVDEVLEKAEAQQKALVVRANEIIDENQAQHKRLMLALRPAQYVGVLAQADLALRADNALRARQLLLSQPATVAYAEITEGKKQDRAKDLDLRGFEWHYLWRHLNSERYLFEGHRGIVTAVAVSADGQRAASASIDGSVRIWNLASGEILAVIEGKAAVNAVAFSPDGKVLASGGADKIVHLWDLSQLKTDFVEITTELNKLAGHGEAINALAFGKDADTLASGGADRSVILWEKGKEKFRLKDHTAAVQALAFSGDGKALVSAGAEAKFYQYDAATGKKQWEATSAYRSIAALSIAGDGKLATGGAERRSDADVGAIRFWNLADGKEMLKPINHSSGVLSLAFAADGKSIASGGKDHMIRLWNTQTGEQKRKWIGHLGAVTALAMAKDDSALVSGSYDASVKAWNPAHSSGPDVLEAHGDWVQALVVNHKGTLLASGARDGSVKLWNPKTGKFIKALPNHAGPVTSLAFSHHLDKAPALLAVGTRDDKDKGEITIWQLDDDAKAGVTAKELHKLSGHAKGITCLEFCPEEEKVELMHLLISGSADQTVKLWDAKAGKEKASHHGHKDEVRCVFFFDGRSFASGGKDGLVCFYQPDSKDINSIADLHLGSIESIALMAFSARLDDEQILRPGVLTGSADQTMRYWDYNFMERNAGRKPTKLSEFRTHAQPLTKVIYHQGKKPMTVSASWDGTVKLYDLFNERFTLIGHHGAVRALAVAPDQSWIASAGHDGTIRIWRAAVERGTK